jgi:hypothetical protein
MDQDLQDEGIRIRIHRMKGLPGLGIGILGMSPVAGFLFVTL